MALNDITLADGQGTPVNHTFTYVSNVGNRVVRSDLNQTAETPLTLSVAHSSSKKNGVQVDSHLARVDLTILDSDGVTPFGVNIRVMADIPAKVASNALADDLAAYIRNFLTSARARTWIKGGVD